MHQHTHTPVEEDEQKHDPVPPLPLDRPDEKESDGAVELEQKERRRFILDRASSRGKLRFALARSPLNAPVCERRRGPPVALLRWSCLVRRLLCLLRGVTPAAAILKALRLCAPLVTAPSPLLPIFRDITIAPPRPDLTTALGRQRAAIRRESFQTREPIRGRQLLLRGHSLRLSV